VPELAGEEARDTWRCHSKATSAQHFKSSLAAHQVVENQLVECRIIAVVDKLLSFLFVESTRLLQQMEESTPTIVEVGKPVIDFCGAERVNIEADVLAVFAVTIAFQGADLIEGDAQVAAAERFVLIKFQAVLIVQMQRPELAEGHCEINFISGVQSGQDGVGGFDEAADSIGIAR